MIRLATNHGRRGSAHNIISGYVSNGSTWSESFVLRDQDGANVTGITGHTFQFQFRPAENDTTSELTLTSGDSQVSAGESGGVTTITIAATQAVIANMRGDYIADLVSKTGSTLTHRGHGKVTFTNAPVAF
jgi:hypothetical protein